MIPEPFARDQGGGCADRLVEGFYLIRMARARRVDMPVRIWFGPPIDPDDPKETLDRSPRWQIQICGALFDQEPLSFNGIKFTSLPDFWPRCARDPIPEDDYAFRIRRQEWAAAYDPLDPMGSPGGKVDPMTARLPGL